VVTKVNDVPAWVKKPPQQEGMLFGIGGAQKGVGSRDAAQKKANVDLSAQICLSLKAVSTTKERYTDKTFGGKRTETAEMTMEQNIETKVAQEAIPGVTVREVAETDKETWVLVACDRAAWAASIRKSIADVDQGLTAQGEELKREAAPSLGVMARASKQILALAAERTVLLRRLRVADPVGELPKAPIDIERFKTDLAKALDAVTISVVAKIGAGGANDALLTNRIAGALGNAGLGVVAEGKPSQLKITFIARFQELTIDEEKKRVNVNLAASFTGADGKQLGSLEAKGSGLSTPDIARDKALDEAVKNVLLEFDKQVFDLLARL
jgi:hypothetical protein